MIERIYTPRLMELLANDAVPLFISPPQNPYDQICQNCLGTGIVLVWVVSGGPFRSPPEKKAKWMTIKNKEGWYTGHSEVDYCPVCRGSAQAEFTLKNCGLIDEELNISYQNIRPFEDQKEAYNLVGSLLGLNNQIHGFITFCGGHGTGKSHLMKATINGVRALGVLARYVRLADLLAEIRETFGNAALDSETVIRRYRQYRVLCIDEVERINLTDWVQEAVFRLFDSRFNEREHLLTLMAMNHLPNELPAELGYLASRMLGGTVCILKGCDKRPGFSTPITDWVTRWELSRAET